MSKKLLVIAVLISVMIMLFSFSSNSPKEINIVETEVVTLTQDTLEFRDSVFNYIQELNIKHPEIVFRQAQIESGNFSSKVFRENNNMFGMRVPFRRANTVIGENRGYAVYESWKHSVLDYALYQMYSAKNLSEEEYIKFLAKNYAEDPHYATKLK